MSLQKKLLGFLIPLISLIVIGMGVFTYTQQRKVLFEAYIHEMKALTSQITLNTQELISSTRANVTLFSESSLVQKYLLTTDEEDRFLLMQPSVLRLFASYQRAYPYYYEIRLLLPNGFEETRRTNINIANTTEEEGRTSVFYAISTAKDDVQSMFLRNPDNNEFSLLVSRRIKIRDHAVDPVDAGDKLRGYLQVTARLDLLDEQLKALKFGESGRIVATNKFGQFVIHTQENDTTTITDTRNFLRLKKSVEQGLPMTLDVNGLSSYVFGDKVSENLYIFAILPQPELRSSIYALALKSTIFAFIAGFVLIFILYKLLNHIIVRPVGLLRDAALDIGQGNFITDIDIASHDEIGELASTFKQMSRDLQKSRDQISYLAYHDNLTGLPNRLMFKEYLKNAIEVAKREQGQIALLFLDLDNFKHINDTIGHHAGDRLLQEFAGKLTASLRGSDYLSRSTIARLGGDEFLMLLPDAQHKQGIDVVAKRLISLASEPFHFNQNEFHVSGSIGISIFPRDGETVDALIRNADAAMYHAKSQGKNTFQYYSDHMNAQAIERVQIENKLRHAIENDELLLHYQPQFDTQSGEMFGVEALLRWQQPEMGMISPARFIPVAEETGLIIPIGEWVIKEACQQLLRWQQTSLASLNVSVNVSSVQLSRIDIHALIKRYLDDNHVPADLLTIELTESTIMESPMRAAEVLQDIKQMGVSISMDDFGTGYSSLSYLRRFPIDHLKIDRSFITEVTENPDDEAIVSTIIAMSKSLHLSVIAEGVETEAQLQLLMEKGCHLIQGYLLGRPVSADQIEAQFTQGLPNTREA